MKLTTILALGGAIAAASTSPSHATHQITSFTSQPSPSTTTTSSTVGMLPHMQDKLQELLSRGTEKIRAAHEKLLNVLENAYAKETLDNAPVNEEQQPPQEQTAAIVAECTMKIIPPPDKETFPFSTSFLSDTITLHPTPEESEQLSSILLNSLVRDRLALFQDSLAETWEDLLSDEEEEEAGIEIGVAGEEDGGVEWREGGLRRTMDH